MTTVALALTTVAMTSQSSETSSRVPARSPTTSMCCLAMTSGVCSGQASVLWTSWEFLIATASTVRFQIVHRRSTTQKARCSTRMVSLWSGPQLHQWRALLGVKRRRRRILLWVMRPATMPVFRIPRRPGGEEKNWSPGPWLPPRKKCDGVQGHAYAQEKK